MHPIVSIESFLEHLKLWPYAEKVGHIHMHA